MKCMHLKKLKFSERKYQPGAYLPQSLQHFHEPQPSLSEYLLTYLTDNTAL